MRKAGYDFAVVLSDIDESDFPCENVGPAEYAKQLALAKATSVAKAHPNKIVIGADTIVDCQGEIIGKPADAKHAEEITNKLFSRPHKVITALAIVKLSDKIQLVESDTTIVYPKRMNERQIAQHIEGKTWQGKAGAYAIQETGDQFVEKVEGSLANVMGMPMELLETMLKSIT
jgi:septum formation protein